MYIIRTVSAWSMLYAILVFIFRMKFVQVQVWNSPLQKLKDESVNYI